MALAMRELKRHLRETGESKGYNASFTRGRSLAFPAGAGGGCAGNLALRFEACAGRRMFGSVGIWGGVAGVLG